MASIKQNLATQPLPDFRNFGVMLRVLLGVNLLAAMAALQLASTPADWLPRFVELAAWVQPLLLFNVAVLSAAGPLLRRLPRAGGQAVVLALAGSSSALLVDFWQFMGMEENGWARKLRAAMLGVACAAALLYYFHLRARAMSPAVSEARLQALTARIRPHFLFNSLNAVLSLIRSEPRRAETALEELADLFRALMRDHRDLLPLADEIALCRQYLDLEKLRLGERLNVEWDVVDVPLDLKVPPLMLQPLLENAVYHGVEPSVTTATVRIRFVRSGNELLIDLANPCPPKGAASGHAGNNMALANIRERLALYYDLEARLETGTATLADGTCEYHVRISLPCRGTRP